MSSARQSFSAEDRLGKWIDLLQIDKDATQPQFETIMVEQTLQNSKARVINQDVLRTRADEPFFQSSFIKAVLKQTLLRFCSYYRIEYMQGLNEILAPFLALNPETFDLSYSNAMHSNVESCDRDQLEVKNIAHPFGINLLIFDKFMSKLSPTTFSTRGVNALQVQLTAFHFILMYHEPTLSIILRKEGMTPDIYAMSWLITLFARRQPLNRALHIMDILLQLNTPHVTVFLAVALLRSHKHHILVECADMLPETLVALKFESDEEIDVVFEDVLKLMASTPQSVILELEKFGFSNSIAESVREKGLKDLWVSNSGTNV